MEGETAKQPIVISSKMFNKEEITDKVTNTLLMTNEKYNNYLSCEMPPPSNSPPSSDFINYYLNFKLTNSKLNLNYSTYQDYQ